MRFFSLDLGLHVQGTIDRVMANTKTCAKCEQDKPLTNFYYDRHADRHRSYCSECWKAHNSQWRRDHPEKARVIFKRAVAAMPERRKAREIVHAAVRRGKLTKPTTCEDCSQEVPGQKLHGHHEDYSKPLEVIWCCDKCHAARHRK